MKKSTLTRFLTSEAYQNGGYIFVTSKKNKLLKQKFSPPFYIGNTLFHSASSEPCLISEIRALSVNRAGKFPKGERLPTNPKPFVHQ